MFSFSGLGSFSVALAEVLDSNIHGFVIVHNIFACFALCLSASQVNMIKELFWFSQVNLFVEYVPHQINVLFLSSQFHGIHIHRQE